MKYLVPDYQFFPESGTILFQAPQNYGLSSFLLITNVTRNVILYNFADPAAGAALATGEHDALVLTLKASTAGMDAADKLQIWVDDGGYPATDDKLDDILGKLPADPATETTLAAVRDALAEMPAQITQGMPPAPQGLASEATLQALRNAISSDPATETTLAAILSKLADAATQNTLAAVLAKLTDDPATATALGEVKNAVDANAATVAAAVADRASEAMLGNVLSALGTILAGQNALATESTLAAATGFLNSLCSLLGPVAQEATLGGVLTVLQNIAVAQSAQTTEVTLTNILGKLSDDPATAAGLTAILEKLSSDPATATGLAAVASAVTAVKDKLPSEPATQATLAAVLNKLPAAPATDSTATAITETLYLLRRLLKTTESLATVTAANQQRVYVDNGSIAVSALPTLANLTNVATLTSLNQMAGFGLTFFLAESARQAFAAGIRANLS